MLQKESTLTPRDRTQPPIPLPHTTNVLAIGRVVCAVVNVVHMVTSPGWEWVGSSRTTRNSEGQEEHKNLSSTIHGG